MNLGKPQIIRANGKDWHLSRLTIRILLAFRDWIAEQVGDPFELADRFLDRISSNEEKIKLIKEAGEIRDQLRGFSLSCELAQRYINTEAGGTKLVQLMLMDRHPSATEDDAFAVLEAMGEKIEQEETRSIRVVEEQLDAYRNGADRWSTARRIVALVNNPQLTMESLARIIETAQGSLPNSPAPVLGADRTDPAA